MRVGLGCAARESGGDRAPVVGGVTLVGEGGSPERRRDPAARALADAVLGAAGLGGADRFFAAGPGHGDRPGLAPLSRAVREVEGENYQVVNVDLTVIGGGAPLGRHEAEIRETLAGHLHVPPEHVSVKPGGGSEPDALRAADGMVVLAVALLDRIDPMDQVHAALRAGG